MAFILDGLDVERYDRTYRDIELLRRVLGYFRLKLPAMIFVVVMIVLHSLTQSAVPLLISLGVDSMEADSIADTGLLLTGAIFLIGILAWTFSFFRQWFSAKVTGDVVLKLRNDAFDAALERDMSFYDKFPSGKIVSRITSDTEDFANVVHLTMILLSQVLMVGFITVLLFLRDAELAFLTLLVMPIIIGLALLFRRIARRSTQHAQRSLARVNANTQEVMGGISVVKNFRQEHTVYSEFQPINYQSYAVTLRQGFVFSAMLPILVLVAGLATVMLVQLGGTSVLDGRLSAGDWYLFLQAVAFFWLPLTAIAAFWSQFQQGLAAAERVFALIDAAPRVVQQDSHPVGNVAGHIEFRKLTFGYEQNAPVLRDFNLTIDAGETVALVGHTGAGKSTLSKLIARFYEFSSGELLIDGRSIRSFNLSEYRRHVGAVPQVPFLFSGTVADNIRYPRPTATDEEVLAAARQIAGGDWLDGLLDGLETNVGEFGQALSMGQRQLVALSRLMIQDPAIVVLDEATASVDPLTEAQISEGLDVVLAGRTSIIIAHRLSTIEQVNRIIVLGHGRIIEEGSHALLLNSGGRYSEVFNTYFRHQSPNYQPTKHRPGSPAK
ncbi:ABC transporter ATP-binding protein [Phytoactinopolyspora limicola]|uniref:ABC transporter ATP-binding protein n=1 Tax=Phytoactinopolyspora limicola TaxID=2715536 RepID=UPI001408A036|nr:ABC transporter ATP-binding protein [Phytoactinopolyspora limicola]